MRETSWLASVSMHPAEIKETGLGDSFAIIKSPRVSLENAQYRFFSFANIKLEIPRSENVFSKRRVLIRKQFSLENNFF